MFSSPLEDKPNGWQQCSGASCSGGIAVATSYWKAQHQTTPSLDGSSTEFFIDGPAYATNLFGLLIANNPASSHFLFDFGVYVDPVSHTAVQALEFDIYHVANGRKYMFGTECDYWSKTWDTWNEQTQRWIPTNAVCTPLSPGAWHRVQWAVERVGSQIHYLTVTVDGVTQRIADAYAYQPAMPSNWDNGNIGVQFQQDLNQSPGSGMHMWVDKVTVYAW